MRTKAKMKLITDLLMTILLLLLMAFELVGRAAHEWIGMGIFALFILHHLLNGSWSRAMFRGKYPPLRVVQTVLATVVFLCMIGLMVSAVIISDEVFAFLNIRGGLRAQNAIAQCEESESHFKYGFSAGLIVQQEAHEQLQNKK